MPIESWDVEKAVEMSKDIKEQHAATPYGFCFITRSREDDELDSKEVNRSGVYFLGGEVLTVKDVERRNDPNEKILLSNMRNNGYAKVVVNTNSWKWTQPLTKNDRVLNV